MIYYAGEEAVRQLVPTQPHPEWGAREDWRLACQAITQDIGGDAAAVELLFSLAERRCALLVTHYEPEIRALAAALEKQLILTAKSAREVFMKSLSERAGRWMTFKSDPTLHGLTGDEAFEAFRRRLNLPVIR
jgi:hypothetical protein